MDASIAKKGGEEIEKVYQLFQNLLEAVGNENLMFNKARNPDPSSVPKKCEENNALIAEILRNIKKSLAEAKQCHQYCQTEISSCAPKMPTLEELATRNGDSMEVEKSKEFLLLEEQLKAKNADLKFIIDEVRHIFTDINQLSTSVPY